MGHGASRKKRPELVKNDLAELKVMKAALRDLCGASAVTPHSLTRKETGWTVNTVPEGSESALSPNSLRSPTLRLNRRLAALSDSPYPLVMILFVILGCTLFRRFLN